MPGKRRLRSLRSDRRAAETFAPLRRYFPICNIEWGMPIMRYVALWFLGVPVSVIVLLALFNVI